MQIHRHKTKQTINKSPTIQSQKNLKQKAPSRDRNTHTQEGARAVCFSMTIPCLTSTERLKSRKSQPSSLLQVTPTGSPFSSGTRQRKSWWETLTDMTRSHLCGMFFLVVTATTEGTEAESSREVGATGGRGFSGLSGVLALPWAVPPLSRLLQVRSVKWEHYLYALEGHFPLQQCNTSWF